MGNAFKFAVGGCCCDDTPPVFEDCSECLAAIVSVRITLAGYTDFPSASCINDAGDGPYKTYDLFGASLNGSYVLPRVPSTNNYKLTGLNILYETIRKFSDSGCTTQTCQSDYYWDALGVTVTCSGSDIVITTSNMWKDSSRVDSGASCPATSTTTADDCFGQPGGINVVFSDPCGGTVEDLTPSGLYCGQTLTGTVELLFS